MSNSFKKLEKPDPFCDAFLGEWKPDKKKTDKTFLAFSRTREHVLTEQQAQEWIDPVDFKKKKVWGKVRFTEYKLISKQNGDASFSRNLEPLVLEGATVKEIPQ